MLKTLAIRCYTLKKNHMGDSDIILLFRSISSVNSDGDDEAIREAIFGII